MSESSIAVKKEDRREFDVELSKHALKEKRDYTQPEFFKLLLLRWKVKS